MYRCTSYTQTPHSHFICTYSFPVILPITSRKYHPLTYRCLQSILILYFPTIIKSIKVIESAKPSLKSTKSNHKSTKAVQITETHLVHLHQSHSPKKETAQPQHQFGTMVHERTAHSLVEFGAAIEYPRLARIEFNVSSIPSMSVDGIFWMLQEVWQGMNMRKWSGSGEREYMKYICTFLREFTLI